MQSPRSNVRRLALSRGISLTGSQAAFTALMFAVYRDTGSPDGSRPRCSPPSGPAPWSGPWPERSATGSTAAGS